MLEEERLCDDPPSAAETDREDVAESAIDKMTPAQLAEAKEYGRQDLMCTIIDRLIDLAFLAVAAFVLARPLDTWLGRLQWFEPLWLRLAAMYLIVTLLHICVSFPLSIYSGHFLEHRYKMSRQSLRRWFFRYAKRNALTIAFGVVLIQGLYWIIWTTGQYWWLFAAGGFFVVSVIMGQLAPVLILPLFYKITRLEDHELSERLSRLSQGTGLSIEGVYRMKMSDETVKANAMLAGLGATRRVIFGDTLLDGFSSDEIDVIFAHEIGHHVHRHMHKLIVAGLVYSTLSFYLCNQLLLAWTTSIDGAVDFSYLPAYTLPMLMLGIAVLSIVFEPLQNIISRHFERQSDWYALGRTRQTEAYRSAFTKLAKLNKADPDPHPLEVFLFHSHPPISQRIAMSERFEAA